MTPTGQELSDVFRTKSRVNFLLALYGLVPNELIELYCDVAFHSALRLLDPELQAHAEAILQQRLGEPYK